MFISIDSKESREVINHGQTCRYFVVRWTLLFKSLAILEEEKNLFITIVLYTPCVLDWTWMCWCLIKMCIHRCCIAMHMFWLLAESLSVFQLKFLPWQILIICRFDLIYVSVVNTCTHSPQKKIIYNKVFKRDSLTEVTNESTTKNVKLKCPLQDNSNLRKSTLIMANLVFYLVS